MGIFSNLFKKRDTSNWGDETKLNTGGFNVIKYEGDDSSIIQKHPVVDFNNSSLLIVHEGQEALFLYDGEFQDKFGPGQYVLETETIAGGEALNERFTNGVNKNHAEVYFVNMTTQMGIKWGTPDRISFREPTYGFLTSIVSPRNPRSAIWAVKKPQSKSIREPKDHRMPFIERKRVVIF